MAVHRDGFTLAEMVATLVIAIICVALIINATWSWGRPRINPRQPQNATQLRNLHQSLIDFSATNKGYFAGLTSTGQVDARAAEDGLRNASLLRMAEEDYFANDYLVSPGETEIHVGGERDAGSYAVLQFADSPEGGPINKRVSKLGGLEWQHTDRSTAIVLSDRPIWHQGALWSVWTLKPGWYGHVVWNDNSVSFEATTQFPDRDLYGSRGAIESEHGAGRIGDLFDAADGDGQMIAD